MDLSSNDLHGSIPSEIGHCTQLTEAYLSENILSELILSQIGEITKLKYLDMY